MGRFVRMNTSAPSHTPLRLNVGCGRNIVPGWVNIDLVPNPGVDISFDLERCGEVQLPFEDNSVAEISLSHLIEHIENTLPLMQELYRVAAPNCLCIIRVPHGSSDDAWTDPTHLRPYFPGSFGYFCQPHYWRADYGYRGDWQPEEVLLMVKKETARGMDGPQLIRAVKHERNVVVEIVAHMRAIKPAREPLRELQVPPEIKVNLA
jgi:ubiquinone/menaquinone biosynthesis C-methylase UbiE